MLFIACLGGIPLAITLALCPRGRWWLALTPGVTLIAAGYLGLGRGPTVPGDDLPDFGPALIAIVGLYAFAAAILTLAARAIVNWWARRTAASPRSNS